jgi:RimJ/RimL family protein N-acetyltransferase
MSEPLIRPMQESDLAEASRIFRVAFGTFLGSPDPESFAAGCEYISTRWRNHPAACLVAEVDGQVVGSNLAAHWGSFGFFGPLTVLPELWGRHIAQKLLAPTMDLFAQWGVREAGLYTFAHSIKHVGLYQRFGFWPGFLTVLMSKDAGPGRRPCVRLSTLDKAGRADAENACRRLTDSIYAGLDVSCEVRAVEEQDLGETVLLWGGDALDGFAVCHCGEGTEAGRDNCYLKFAAVRPGPGAEKALGALLEACETLAAERGLKRLVAGVNTGRIRAYREMLRLGFRTDSQGVAMHRPDTGAYNRADVFVIDDWR